MRVFVLNKENGTPKLGNFYRFRSRGKTIPWPMHDGAHLGAAGCWNFLFRLGVQPEYSTPGDVAVAAKGDLLFVVAEDEELCTTVRGSIDRWLANGGTVIASGYLSAWRWLLPAEVAVEQEHCESPYSALGWMFADNPPDLVAPPRWSYGRLTNNGDVLTYGKLVAIRGERQTPHRALVTLLRDAPALIRHKNFIFLNGNPFAAFQAWLQGQEDLGPWLQWRHRLFWLDEQASFLLKVLNNNVQLSQQLVPRPIAGLPETVVVLCHDLDHSRDTSYMEAERAVGVPGVHAVLRDCNTNFWLETLRQAPEHEVAFHYTTARYNRLLEGVRSKVGLPKRPYRPARHEIVGDGLQKQVRWAKGRGIGVATLHRHQPFLIYPEWVDALNIVFEEEPEVLGGSSLFRGQVLRWGCDRSDGIRGTYGDFPDSQFPYWFPCKLAHAGLGGRLLRGWEASSVMEIEPELFEQILDYRVEGLPHRIITINYHPAHARQPTFCRQGSLSCWEDILRIVRERGIEVRTLRDIYSTLDKIALNCQQGKG